MAAHPDGQLRDLLVTQHGVLGREQARIMGLSEGYVEGQIRRGRWQRLSRGVYATFTGPPGRSAQLWAALLRAGPSSALSHQSAAEVDGLLDGFGPAVHVMISHGQRIQLGSSRNDAMPRMIIHRSRRLAATRHPSRIPARTRIEETTFDLAQSAGELDEALGWLIRACGRRLTTASRLRAALAARPGQRWRHELALALADIGDGAHSMLELRYVRQVETPHGLPRAARQAHSTVGAQTRYLDNLYQPFGVAVELDGRVAHPADTRWRDIRRDNSSATVGVLTLRYNWADVTVDPCLIAAQIATVLSQRGWPGSPRRCSPHCPLPS